MEQLIADIEAYSAAHDVPPQVVLRRAINAGWTQWDRWKAGGGCTVKNMMRLREYMRAHPADDAA